MKYPISRYTLAIFLVTAIALSVGNAKAAQTAGSFVPTFGTMMTPREDHAAALLQNALVLIAGGETAVPCCTGNTGEGPPLSSAELFNPSTGMFSPTGSMTTGRIFPIAVTLPNGQVLVTDVATADLHSPSMHVANGPHTLSTTSFASNGSEVGSNSIIVHVANAASGLRVCRKSSERKRVSATVPVLATAERGVQWIHFYVDGNYFASSPPVS